MHHPQKYYRKIIILILCFLLTSILIYRTPTSTAVNKPIPLTQALSDIKGWTSSGLLPLNPRIVEVLELDDYINQNCFNGHERVSLYICPGYSISYFAMTVQRGEEKQLIIYWFQSYDQTNPNTFEKNLRNAIELYLEDIREHPDTAVSPISTEELIEFFRDTGPEWYKEPSEGLLLRPLEVHEVPSYA